MREHQIRSANDGLGLCQVCHLTAEGSTTECPGQPSREYAEDVLKDRMDFRGGRWHPFGRPERDYAGREFWERGLEVRGTTVDWLAYAETPRGTLLINAQTGEMTVLPKVMDEQARETIKMLERQVLQEQRTVQNVRSFLEMFQVNTFNHTWNPDGSRRGLHVGPFNTLSELGSKVLELVKLWRTAAEQNPGLEKKAEGIPGLQREIAELHRKRAIAYTERNRLFLLCCKLGKALGMRVGVRGHVPIGDEDDWEREWNNVGFLELPAGQVSFHLHEKEAPVFLEALGVFPEPWDGHENDEKWRRVEEFDPGAFEFSVETVK